MTHKLPHGKNLGSVNTNMTGFTSSVVTNHWLASMVGRDILNKGGNAFDAACAISFMLGVVEPQMSGIGGDGFIMMFDNNEDKVSVINATGPAPEFSNKIKELSFKSIKSSSVPGLVSGVLKMHELKGRLTLDECIKPSIEAATNGVPLSEDQSESLISESEINKYSASMKIWGDKNTYKRFGSKVINNELAKTLEEIVSGGADAFYRGEISKKIVEYSKINGGFLSIKDFENFDAEIVDPISTNYRGYEVFESPPNSSGITLLQQLNIIENFDSSILEPGTYTSIHAMAEAKRLAFFDREKYLADPKFIEIPVDKLLNKEYSQSQFKKISLDKRIDDSHLEINYSPDKVGDTTYFCVLDREGNAVSQLQSIQTQWGSGDVVEGTGILMNNRMTYWHLDKDHINILVPGKRVRHTMNPVMVFKKQGNKNNLRLICGTPGADTQVQTNMQTISSFIDFNYKVGESVSMPRWTHYQNLTESTIPHSIKTHINIEDRFGINVKEKLEMLGHVVEMCGPWEGKGSEGMISLDQNGLIGGAVDPRRDGQALVW
ncbi:MAG: gamma-glutamyltransferase [Chloroflexi bacterium]|nr:gamma-glutamyltransferase [Chloroflexota bacterium]